MNIKLTAEERIEVGKEILDNLNTFQGMVNPKDHVIMNVGDLRLRNKIFSKALPTQAPWLMVTGQIIVTIFFLVGVIGAPILITDILSSPLAMIVNGIVGSIGALFLLGAIYDAYLMLSLKSKIRKMEKKILADPGILTDKVLFLNEQTPEYMQELNARDPIQADAYYILLLAASSVSTDVEVERELHVIYTDPINGRWFEDDEEPPSSPLN